MGLRTPIWRVPLLAALLIATAAWAQTGSTHTVIMRQMHFDPPALTVQAGDTVEWSNQDIFAHTATADDKSFDSGLLQPGQSWKVTMAEAGDVGYHCTPHPNMKAKLVVAAGSVHQGMHSGTHSDESIRFRIPSSPEELHPILVNFTAALLPLAFLSDVLGRIFKRQSLHNAATWMVLYEALLTPLTVAAGWWWKHQSGSDLPHKLITIHQWLGSSAALLFIVLALWRWSIHKRGVQPSNAYLIVTAALIGALAYQGSLGGAMVFGK